MSALLLLFSVLAHPVLAGAATPYSDVPENAWYAYYVNAATGAGMVTGYADSSGNPTGRFGPEAGVTVAEFLKMALYSAGYHVPPHFPMPEVPDTFALELRNNWYRPYIYLANQKHFSYFRTRTGGYDLLAQRAEVAQIITDVYGLDTLQTLADDLIGKRKIKDVRRNDQYAPAIAKLFSLGIMTGDAGADGFPLGRVRPYDMLNRAEAVAILLRAQGKFGPSALVLP